MTQHPPASTPTPTPLCASFAPLLPLLDSDALTHDEARATRDHLATCAWCRAQQATYAALDMAALRHLSPESKANWLPLQLEDIMRTDDIKVMIDDRSDDDMEAPSLAPRPPQVDSGHRPRRPRPRLIAEIAAVLVVALLATALLVNRAGLFNGLAFGPTPLKTAAGAVIFTHSVAWGRLTLNGKTIGVTTTAETPLYLPRGQNTLVYQADPWPTLSCTISAPASPDDTCPLRLPDPTYSGPSFSGRAVDLGATPQHLPAAQRDALVSATQHALDDNVTIAQILPGDHFITTEGTAATVTQTFNMTLGFQASASAINPDINPCSPFCTLPNAPDDGAAHWITTPANRWQYSWHNGQLITVLQGPRSDGGAAVAMAVMWTGAWQVTIETTNLPALACNALILSDLSMPAPNVGFGIGCIEHRSSLPLADGMLIPVTFSGNASGSPTETANILYRAGVLLAVDANAHYLYPSLPSPSAHELAIARSLGFQG